MAVRGRVLGRGERVHIHAPGVRDRDELLALARRSRALHRGWISPPRTPGAFAAYLARLREGRSEGFLLRRNADGALLGLVNLNEIVRGSFQSAYLGYWIGAPYARHGYMGEGLALVLRHAFGRLRLHRLEANVQPANVASAALVRRLGFRKEGRSRRYLRVGGRWRDHDRFALLAEGWRAARRPR
jgi:ribosomal-protein-alanine N-acetyltransferase